MKIKREMIVNGEQVTFIVEENRIYTPTGSHHEGRVTSYRVHCIRANGEEMYWGFPVQQSTEAIIQGKKKLEEIQLDEKPSRMFQIMGRTGMTLGTESAKTAQGALDLFARKRHYASWKDMNLQLRMSPDFTVQDGFRILLDQKLV
jgi:hypothetical protein